jgi:preprotein translocase subunit SecE
MAKIASDKSAGKGQLKQTGPIKNILDRSSLRSSSARPVTAPRGAVSTKPQGRVRTFLREVKVELSKVTWPPRRELLQATGVVIIAVIVAGVFIGIFDFIWNVIVRSVGLG